MPRLLALDFDGVISDSAPEAFTVALLAYMELQSGSQFCDRRTTFSEDRAPALEAIASDPLYAPFLELMPLGNRAEDFAISLSALEAGQALQDQSAYDHFRSTISQDWLQTFHARFYEIRGVLSKRDPKGWRLLMGPYPAFLDVLQRRAQETILAIVTAKDRRSVALLLRDYGIEDLFSDERVLDKETGVHKDAHIRHLRRTLGVEFEEMAFIDDKVNHLDTVSALGVRCVLATWGYNGDREVELARKRGYLVCDLSSIESRLFTQNQ